MPSASECPRIDGTGSRICSQQIRDVGERQRLKINRSGVQREHDDGTVVQQHAKVTSVGGIAGEREDARVSCSQTAFVQIPVRCAQCGCQRFDHP